MDDFAALFWGFSAGIFALNLWVRRRYPETGPAFRLPPAVPEAHPEPTPTSAEALMAAGTGTG